MSHGNENGSSATAEAVDAYARETSETLGVKYDFMSQDLEAFDQRLETVEGIAVETKAAVVDVREMVGKIDGRLAGWGVESMRQGSHLEAAERNILRIFHQLERIRWTKRATSPLAGALAVAGAIAVLIAADWSWRAHIPQNAWAWAVYLVSAY